jgi:glycosyltransferase involved in cell wall biosynthesis
MAAVAGEATGVALVHEWLASRAGSEKTFERMTQVLPGADVYALTADRAAGFEIEAPIRTTVLQRLPVLRDKRNLSLPVMPLAWRCLRTKPYATVITSTHAYARFVPAARAAAHLSYVYTPLRYAWLPEVDGRGATPLMAPARAALRGLDKRSVRHVDRFAAISNVVRERIEEFYDREAEVVFPPVDTEYFAAAPGGDAAAREPFVLGVSRWIRYKRLDLVIDAASRLGLPAVIAGHGPGEAELRTLADRAGVPVTFERRPSDERLRELYRTAAVLVFPAEEDFGIVPVEAQSAGTPVVAYARGGSLDTVDDGVSGALVHEQTAEAFAAGIERVLGMEPNAAGRREHAERFSVEAFRRGFADWVKDWIPDGHLCTVR